MAISKEDVQHIAALARIGLSDEEVEKFKKDLESILDYVKELQEVDTKNIEPTSQVTGSYNVIREDEGEKRGDALVHDAASAAKLVEAAPETKDGYIKVKAVFE